jgi:hypothetical protein
MVSKKAIYDLIPAHYYPKTELIKNGTPIAQVEKTISDSGIKYPLIAKPDIGLLGSGVNKISTVIDLKQYALNANFDYLIQDLIPFQNEVGIFYVRYPDQNSGKLTGIVSKEFIILIGTGAATIEELIKGNLRYELQLKVLRAELGEKL